MCTYYIFTIPMLIVLAIYIRQRNNKIRRLCRGTMRMKRKGMVWRGLVLTAKLTLQSRRILLFLLKIQHNDRLGNTIFFSYQFMNSMSNWVYLCRQNSKKKLFCITEAASELGWAFTIAIVAVISALLGAIIMIAFVRCKR